MIVIELGELHGGDGLFVLSEISGHNLNLFIVDRHCFEGSIEPTCIEYRLI